jgi:hypothetical protein
MLKGRFHSLMTGGGAVFRPLILDGATQSFFTVHDGCAFFCLVEDLYGRIRVEE